MIIKLHESASLQAVQGLIDMLAAQGIAAAPMTGTAHRLLGLSGDITALDVDSLRALAIVQGVQRITPPYRAAARSVHPADTVIDVQNVRLGGGHFAVIAGPCSVESEAQIIAVAEAVKAAGASMLRGGAFKPRTSPYTFDGLHAEGIRLLLLAKAQTGLPVVSEIMDIGQLPLFDAVDIVQIGARNMQNYALLHAVGKLQKPVLLKRGLSSTLEELLMSAEHIMAAGNSQVILCERGIRTFEHYTRNTLDLSAIPALKALSHLPVIADPSHGTGVSALVPPMALAATAAGADGLMIEVHNNPAQARCDGPQALTPAVFDQTMQQIARIRQAIN